MKRTYLLTLLFVLAVVLLLPWSTRRTSAQAIVPPIQIQSTIPHTSCTVTASVTTYCFASDGLFVSLNGGAFAALSNGGGGVTSVTVCMANGTSCGTPQTGAVSINVPKSATSAAPAVTLQ